MRANRRASASRATRICRPSERHVARRRYPSTRYHNPPPTRAPTNRQRVECAAIIRRQRLPLTRRARARTHVRPKRSHAALKKAQRGNASDRRHQRARLRTTRNRRSIATRRDRCVVRRSQTDVATSNTSRIMGSPQCDARMADTRVAAPHARAHHALNRVANTVGVIRRDHTPTCACNS